MIKSNDNDNDELVCVDCQRKLPLQPVFGGMFGVCEACYKKAFQRLLNACGPEEDEEEPK